MIRKTLFGRKLILFFIRMETILFLLLTTTGQQLIYNYIPNSRLEWRLNPVVEVLCLRRSVTMSLFQTGMAITDK